MLGLTRTFRYGIISAVVLLMLSLYSGSASAAAIRYAEGDEGLAVATIQLKLRNMGFYHEAITGKYDKKTVAAVRELQQSRKMNVNGIVDDGLYQILNGGAVTVRPDKQPSVAPPTAPVVDHRNVVPLIKTAMQYIGTPYRFGGVAPGGFDCSGYTSYVFGKNGFSLPRTADVQFKVGKPVNRGALQAGDLVFFTTYEPGPSHVGIYTAEGRFIHASSSKGVMISGLDDSYWKTRYLGARRVL